MAPRRYYLPTDQGYEATLAARMAARAEAREAGKPRKCRLPRPELTRGGGDIMRTREANRKRLAETEKRDADG